MLERKFDENYLQYTKRITNYLEEGKIAYDEWGDLLLGIDNVYSADNCRKASYFLRKLLPKIDGTVDISDEDIIKALEEQKNEIYKEKCKLADQRREYNKALRSDARYEHLVEMLVQSMEDMPELSLHEHSNPIDTGVEAALLISDLHYGATIDNVFNLYNSDVCKERMNTLLDKTIYYCSLHRVDTIYVCLGGDLVSGLIHGSVRCESDEDIITQTIQVSELLCQFISRLSQYVPNVKVVCVQGNHSRVTPNLKDNINEENFERIIFEYLKIRLTGITIIQNGKEDWCCFKIKDRNVMLEHGDKIKLANVKEKAVNMLGYAPDDIFLGHYHRMEVLDENGTDVVVNGSVMGVDSYSMKCRFNSKPHQVLRIYGDDVLTYKIMLDK